MLFNLQHILQPLHWRQRFHQGKGRLFFRNSKLSTLQICMKEGIFLSLKNIFSFVKEVPPKVAHILGKNKIKVTKFFYTIPWVFSLETKKQCVLQKDLMHLN